MLSELARAAAVAAMTVLVAACAASSPQKLAPPAFAASGLADGGCVSLVIGAVEKGEDRSGFFDHILVYRRVGSEQRGRWKHHRDPLFEGSPDLREPNLRATAQRTCLQAGDYEIFRFELTGNVEGRIDTAAISNDVALRFRVEAGRETYLGRLVAHGIWKTNFLGLPFPSTATFVIEDALERDEAALRTRFPETGAVVRDVLRPAFSDAPAFVAKSVGAAGALESEGPSAVVD